MEIVEPIEEIKDIAQTTENIEIEPKVLENKDKKDLVLLPIEELLKLIGVTDENIIYLDDEDLDELCDEISDGKSVRLRLKLKLHKIKMEEEKETQMEEKQRLKEVQRIRLKKQEEEAEKTRKETEMTSHDKYLLSQTGYTLELLLSNGLLSFSDNSLSPHVKTSITKIITEYNSQLKLEEEEKRLLEEDHQNKIKEQKAKDEQEKQAYIQKTFLICPYCSQMSINKKDIKKNETAICQNIKCGKKVDLCGLCKKVIIPESEKEHDCEVVNNTSMAEVVNMMIEKQKIEEEKLLKQEQDEMLRRQQAEILRQEEEKQRLILEKEERIRKQQEKYIISQQDKPCGICGYVIKGTDSKCMRCGGTKLIIM